MAELGYTVETHTYPMPHSVCAEEVRDIGDWLYGCSCIRERRPPPGSETLRDSWTPLPHVTHLGRSPVLRGSFTKSIGGASPHAGGRLYSRNAPFLLTAFPAFPFRAPLDAASCVHPAVGGPHHGLRAEGAAVPSAGTPPGRTTRRKRNRVRRRRRGFALRLEPSPVLPATFETPGHPSNPRQGFAPERRGASFDERRRRWGHTGNARKEPRRRDDSSAFGKPGMNTDRAGTASRPSHDRDAPLRTGRARSAPSPAGSPSRA